MPLQRLIPLKYGCLTGLASTACALLGVAIAQAKPPEKPSYLASMKSVHTVEQTHHTYSPRKDNGSTPT